MKTRVLVSGSRSRTVSKKDGTDSLRGVRDELKQQSQYVAWPKLRVHVITQAQP